MKTGTLKEYQTELLTQLAVMQLQTAFFHPTAEGSAEAFGKYLELQIRILLSNLETTLNSLNPTTEKTKTDALHSGVREVP